MGLSVEAIESACMNLKEQGHDVVVYADRRPELNIERAAGADIVVESNMPLRKDFFNACPNLKMLSIAFTGLDHIDMEECKRRDILVKNAAGYSTEAVAEETICMMIGLYRHVIENDKITRSCQGQALLPGREIAGKTVGIIGLGNIGRQLVKRLQGFECKVLGYDHFLSRQRALNIGATPAELSEIFSTADIISIHVPGGPATKNYVNAELIGKMKDGAMLVNCARYGVVDEDALRAAKGEGKNIIYCTDVHPKDTAANQPSADIADIMLPHLGANTKEANKMAAMRAASQMHAYFAQGDTSCVVNAEMPHDLNPAHLHLAAMLGKLCCHAAGCKPIRRIDCTFYNNLRSFRKWFTPWVLEGAVPGAEHGLMPPAAEASFREHGIVYKACEPMDDKLYEDQLTIDIHTEDAGQETITSVRGMIVDETPVVSRIGGFKHLYAALPGNTLVLRYADRPGVVASIGQTLSDAGINIENIVAPTDHASGDSLAIVKTDKPVSDVLVEILRKTIDAKLAFAITM